MKFRERHSQTKGGPKEDHKDHLTSGEHAQWGKIRSVKSFLPGEGKSQDRPTCSILVLKEQL